MNRTINILQSHRSIRKFTNKKIEEEKLKAILTSAQAASTSSFMQAYTIITVNDLSKRRKIASLSGNQSYIEECPVFLVFCADLHRFEIACSLNNKEMISGYTEAFIISTIDATLAAQNAITAAESLDLGGVYIGGIRNNPEEISKLLKLPSNVYAVFGLCLGYPDESPDLKPRLPLSAVVCENEYNIDSKTYILKLYDEEISSYYSKRTKETRNDTWTGQMSALVSKPLRPHMSTFLKSKGFIIK